MSSRFSALSITTLALCFSSLAFPAAITVNSTCEVGNCSSVDSVSSGQSVGPANFNFNYVFANGDIYNLAGTYSASYGNDGSAIVINFSAIYTGATASVGNDVLTFDILQNYFDNSPGTFDGTYTENVPVTLGTNVGAGSNITAQLFYDGKGVGLVGPFGVGTNYASKSANLTGLTGDYLDADFNFTFDFMAGSQPGSGGTVSSTTPEPAQLLPFGGSLLLAALLLSHQSRKRTQL